MVQIKMISRANIQQDPFFYGTNIYVGMSVRLAHLVSNNEPDNFRNLWIPGFNKVTDESKWGVGFNYSLSYFLPLYKKAKKKRKKPNLQPEE